MKTCLDRFTIFGARGSRPVSDPACARFGGETTCFGFETQEGHLIVDAGTGIVRLGETLTPSQLRGPITILFTHFHIDHIVGLPFFAPLYNPDATIHLVGVSEQVQWITDLRNYVGQPYFPLSLEEMPATVTYETCSPVALDYNVAGIQVHSTPLNHPQGCRAFRFDRGDYSIVVATDHEPGNKTIDASLESLCQGVDLLICDAQYTPDELPQFKGWGHGTWEHAANLASRCGVGELMLTHHDPGRTDDQLDSLVKNACKIFTKTTAARRGQERVLEGVTP